MESIVLRRRWTMWKPIFNSELMAKANQADAESMADEGHDGLGNAGIIVALVLSLIPVAAVLVGMLLETLLMLLFLPVAMAWREWRGKWIIEAIDKKRGKYYFWEERGFVKSRRLMKQIAEGYRKNPNNPLP